MSPEDTVVLHPEVLDFVAVVRAQLVDLDVDELGEILDGLEADLNELVGERGAGALGDPVAYAQELRVAAGLADPTRTRRRSRSVRDAVAQVLDASSGHAATLVARMPAEVEPLVAWFRPVWWIARAWVAVELLDQVSGWGLLPLLVAVPLSVQVGRGRLWPGGERGLATRMSLLALNVFAMVMLPVALHVATNGYDNDYGNGYTDGLADAQFAADLAGPGLVANDQTVTNVYPYDAQGRPLTGVQLYDQDGKPLAVSGRPTCPGYEDPALQVVLLPEEYTDVCTDRDGNTVPGRVFYPWTNGQAQMLNAFPVPSRLQTGTTPSATAYAEKDRPKLGPFPLAQVPEIALPPAPERER